jgi:hypothetical protein
MASSVVSRKLVMHKPGIYTIADRNMKPFSLQIIQSKSFEKSITKTTIVAFNNEVNALEMAYLLENHKRIRHEWPHSIFDNDTLGNAFTMYGDMRNLEKAIQLSELSIQQWTNDELLKYCIKNIMDILYIKKLDEHKNGKYSISGELHRIDADFEYYIQLFNEKYNDTSVDNGNDDGNNGGNSNKYYE